MSRIDEALKRASEPGSLTGREFHRTTESPLRLAEDVTLNEYPAEGRSSAPPAERLAPPGEFPSPVTVSHDPLAHVGVKRSSLPSDELLVTAPVPHWVSVAASFRLALGTDR